ncbi:5967_t:CDS:2, partial [Funneliformis caledonium]
VIMYLSPECFNALKYPAFWRNRKDPSLKKFLDFRRCMGDLNDPEMEHSRYNLEQNAITSYYNETTEIGKKAQKLKKEFKARYFVLLGFSDCLFAQTPCELLACKAKVACLSVDDKKSSSVKLFWNLEDIIMESEVVNERAQLQWKEGMMEFEEIGLSHLKETSSAVKKKQISTYKRNASKIDEETVSATSTKKAKTFNVSFDEYVENDRSDISDDSEILDVEPLSGWEFDTPMPS